MGDRRKARRYAIYLPVQVYTSRKSPQEFFTAQLRDISRSGVYFHSSVLLEPGSALELTFALLAEKSGGPTVLVRASAKALRVAELPGEDTPLYGVAATIDRIDFIRPTISHAA
ncbi:MAG: PilZ domain-containing protein [Candidatus Acidiferrales bacterium]